MPLVATAPSPIRTPGAVALRAFTWQPGAVAKLRGARVGAAVHAGGQAFSFNPGGARQ